MFLSYAEALQGGRTRPQRVLQVPSGGQVPLPGEWEGEGDSPHGVLSATSDTDRHGGQPRRGGSVAQGARGG